MAYREAAFTNAFKYPADLTTPPHEKWILFEARSGRHIARDGFVFEADGKDDTLASVALYLPQEALKSAMSVDYKTIDLGMAAGKAIETAFQTGGSLRAPVQGTNPGSSTINTVLGITGAGVAGAVTKVALDAFDNFASAAIDDPKAALEVAVGGRINPRTDTAFDRMQFRTHEFVFNLIPRTKGEADSIDAILNILHFYSLPSYGDAKLATNFMIGYPYEFVITMFNETHLNKIERSVLTGMAVDHAGGDRISFVGEPTQLGVGVHDPKALQEYYPAATSLTLSFQEVRLLGRDLATKNVILRGDGTGIGKDPRGSPDLEKHLDALKESAASLASRIGLGGDENE